MSANAGDLEFQSRHPKRNQRTLGENSSSMTKLGLASHYICSLKKKKERKLVGAVMACAMLSGSDRASITSVQDCKDLPCVLLLHALFSRIGREVLPHRNALLLTEEILRHFRHHMYCNAALALRAQHWSGWSSPRAQGTGMLWPVMDRPP